MTGGGIGQICNSLPFDPHKHDEVIIKGGTNEMNTESLHEFVYQVHTAAVKLRDLAAKTPVTLILPTPYTETPVLEAKGIYLREKLTKIESVKHVLLENIELEDARHHPTITGTASIIKQLNEAIGGEIILKECEDHVVSLSKYREVQSIYKVGCRGCDSLIHTSSLCEKCITESKNVNIDELTDAMRILSEKAFPAMEVDESNEKEKKRTLSESNDDEEPNSQIAKIDPTN